MSAYLKQPRGKGYSFQITVPKALYGRFQSSTGHPLHKIVEGLNTDSEREAKRLAVSRRAHWEAQFARAKQNTPFTLGEIEDAARDCYRATLARMAAEADAMRDIFRGMSGRENAPEADELTWLQSGLDLREKALANGDYSLVAHEIETLARRHGIELDPASPTYATLARALLRAQAAAITGRIKLRQGQPSEPPATFLGPEGIDERTLKPIALHRPIARLKAEHGPWALFEAWIAEAKPAGSTINRWRAVFLDLQNRFADREITATAAAEWAQGLITPDRSPITVSDIWLSSARSVYAWASGRTPPLTPSNPFEKVRVTVPKRIKTREKAFTAKEAQTILRAALAIDADKGTFAAAQRWVPWLQAYSGARAGEICQLRGQDIVQIDDVWAMKLTPEAGTTKTKEPRTIPLHEHLIEMGFLDFVKSRGKGPLFYNTEGTKKNEGETTNPTRPRAVKTRERLAAWVRSLGITDRELSPTHSWRHLFKTIAARSDIADRMSDAITGHAPATVAGRYVHPEPKDMAVALAKFPRFII